MHNLSKDIAGQKQQQEEEEEGTLPPLSSLHRPWRRLTIYPELNNFVSIKLN